MSNGSVCQPNLSGSRSMEDAPTLRARTQADRRERIESTAFALFVARGYDAVTVADIAAAADVAPRTLFRYFPAKEDLLFARDDEVRAVIEAALGSRPAGERAGDTIRAALHAMAGWTAANETLVRRRERIVAASPALAGRNAVKRAGIDELVAGRLRAQLGAGADDPRPLFWARLASVAYDTAVDLWLAHGGDLHARVDEVLAVLPGPSAPGG
jgi:AcrR family transcriptional regulator